MIKIIILLLMISLVPSCTSRHTQFNVDVLIKSAVVYDGTDSVGVLQDIAICGEIICFIGHPSDLIIAKTIINADGMIVTPGFIDPHTHSLEELLGEQHNNTNYLTQGVTTVINGNDGGGTFEITKLKNKLNNNGIGTNTAFLVGHGKIRTEVMGLSTSSPSKQQLNEMKSLVKKAMEEGALGFSTGLYYVPGSYSKTKEVIELAKIAAEYDGIYDTHIRDESTFNIGFLNAIQEVIDVGKSAKINVHIAHIKALGVDVWGQSKQAILMINKARIDGLQITADQYPWQASGTFLHSAVIPAWVMADSGEAFSERLLNENLLPTIRVEIKENIRKRGGAKALLITATKNQSWQSKTLFDIAKNENLSAENMVIKITLEEKVRVASFNMSLKDIEQFMVQPWVISSSDGTNGHPRKYASFPQKYQQFVSEKKLLSLQSFIYKSSGLTSDIFQLKNRGYLKKGYYADINIINLQNFKANASFAEWQKLSSGIEYQYVNGKSSIINGAVTGVLSGKVLIK